MLGQADRSEMIGVLKRMISATCDSVSHLQERQALTRLQQRERGAEEVRMAAEEPEKELVTARVFIKVCCVAACASLYTTVHHKGPQQGTHLMP